MSDIADQVQASVEKGSESKLNSRIAVAVALCATFMALCNVKDGNVVQAMQQVQTQAVDQWAFYQAKSTKQHIAENTAELLRIQLATTPGLKPETEATLSSKVAEYEGQAKKYEKEKGEIQAQAKAQEKAYQDLNVFDDQFDMADACLSVAIAMFGITALTQKTRLFWFAALFAGFGMAFGLSGFLHSNLHPDWLAALLG